MDYNQACTRLLNHANLPPTGSTLRDEESFLFVLWKAERDRAAPVVLEDLYGDILACLEVVNRSVNGPIPSETSGSEKGQIERSLVYALWMILHESSENLGRWRAMELFGASFLNQLSRLIWCISCAWAAVLAGDIDSLEEHVRLELGARDSTL